MSNCKASLSVYRNGAQDKSFDAYEPTWEWISLCHNRKIIFIVHGFKSSSQSEWVAEMKDALLKAESESTVVLVDWKEGASGGATTLYYPTAVDTMVKVGEWLGHYIKKLRETYTEAYIHGIGHSLGAHLLGHAARTCGRPFNRISGLDPAGPLLERKDLSKMLKKDDVVNGLVDVIHTDGHYNGVAIPNHYGTLLPCGTVDFYPNNGTSLQPGTYLRPITGIGKSHGRAYQLYTWSISNPGKFKTRSILDGIPEYGKPVTEIKQGSEVEMGYHIIHAATTQDNYYIKTNASEPWAPAP